MKIKHCIRCDQDKPIIFFAHDRNRPDGRTTYCKACKRQEINRWYRETTGRGVGKMPGQDWMNIRRVRD